MKKTLLTICLAVLMCIGVGCKQKEIEYDVETDGWELWATGVIDEARIEINGDIRKFIIEFIGDLKIEEENFYNFKDVKEGMLGSVYRFNKGGLSGGYVYMWKEDTSMVSTGYPPKNADTPAIPLPPKTFNVIKSDTKETTNSSTISTPIVQWVMVNSMRPPVQQTVLVKFENNLITTAYYTKMGEWKAEIDRKKMSGGTALKNVVQWKFVNLE